MKLKHLLAPLAVALMLASCQKNDTTTHPAAKLNPGSVNTTSGSYASTQTFDEGFESAVKTAYADADVTFTSGSWDLNDALIGTSASDAKVGAHSVRIHNVGTLGMNFDVTTGASTVTMQYAVFGFRQMVAALIHRLEQHLSPRAVPHWLQQHLLLMRQVLCDSRCVKLPAVPTALISTNSP